MQLAPHERAIESGGPALPPPRPRHREMASEREGEAGREGSRLGQRPALPRQPAEPIGRAPATRGPPPSPERAAARQVAPEDAIHVSKSEGSARQPVVRRVTGRSPGERTVASDRPAEEPSRGPASRRQPRALPRQPGAARRPRAERDITAGSDATIRVKIGRIEIKSSSAPTRSKRGPRSPAVSLGRYLERRREEAQ